MRWSVEPFELWLAGGAASPDFKEWVLLGLGGLNYLIALTDSISLVNQAQFYLGDKRFEGLLLGLGARVIY